jgi:hypothetical protein
MSTRTIAAAIADSSPAWQSKASPIDTPREKIVVVSASRPVTVREGNHGNALKVIVLAMDKNTQRAPFLELLMPIIRIQEQGQAQPKSVTARKRLTVPHLGSAR